MQIGLKIDETGGCARIACITIQSFIFFQISRFLGIANAFSMHYLLRKLNLMILFFYRTILSCLEVRRQTGQAGKAGQTLQQDKHDRQEGTDKTDRTGRKDRTSRKDRTNRTDKIDIRLDFPGNLCKAAFAILALFSLCKSKYEFDNSVQV